MRLSMVGVQQSATQILATSEVYVVLETVQLSRFDSVRVQKNVKNKKMNAIWYQ